MACKTSLATLMVFFKPNSIISLQSSSRIIFCTFLPTFVNCRSLEFFFVSFCLSHSLCLSIFLLISYEVELSVWNNILGPLTPVSVCPVRCLKDKLACFIKHVFYCLCLSVFCCLCLLIIPVFCTYIFKISFLCLLNLNYITFVQYAFSISKSVLSVQMELTYFFFVIILLLYFSLGKLSKWCYS